MIPNRQNREISSVDQLGSRGLVGESWLDGFAGWFAGVGGEERREL